MVVDGRDCSVEKQSVLTKVVVNARWSSMAGVAKNRFYCIVKDYYKQVALLLPCDAVSISS